MIRKDGAVWPRQRLRLFPIKFANAKNVEDYLEGKFIFGYPVLFSSGRVALSTVLKTFYKKDLVHLFPYASQCVVKSVLHANLIPVTPLDSTVLDISYNQWGRFNNAIKTSPFIEDSIDSLYPIGAKILRSGADFEVWSLAKIFGLKFGAIMWCRDRNQAHLLRNIRDNNTNTKLSIIRFLLSIIKGWSPISFGLWEKLEFRNLPLLSIECGIILNSVLEWENFYKSRLETYKSVIGDLSSQETDVNVENENVIPVVIELPLEVKPSCNSSIKNLHRIVGLNKSVRVNVIAYQEHL